MKRTLSFFLSLVLLVAVFAPLASVCVFAETSGDWRYTVSNRKATITKYTGSASSVTIPSTFGSCPVTGIGNSAFYNCTSLTLITIPDSVTSIGSYAFAYCSLRSITIPNSVTSIGSSAFYYCRNLTSVTIPDSVTSIENYAFYGCTSLTSITIPDGVTSIGDYAFAYCSLRSITIPDSVTSIGEYAFLNCTRLSSITIPDSVTSIGRGAFYGCNGLTSITIGNGVTSIGSSAFSFCTSLSSINVSSENQSYSSLNGVLFNKGQTVLISCPGGKTGSYTIPDSVTSIGNYAFSSCTSLTSITIPDSVTGIGDDAFYYCRNLTSITIPNSVTSIGGGAFRDCTKLTSITIPESVTSIGGSAFSDCTKLTSVTIPDSVTSIGRGAFSGCTSLTSITIPDSVTSIGYMAFGGCTNLTSITIPDGVTSIGESAFSNCTSLTSIAIPESVTSIGDDAFAYCTNLTDAYFYGSPSFGSNVFSYYQNGYKPLSVTLHGNAGSSVEAYANQNSLQFMSFLLGDVDINGTVDLLDLSALLNQLCGNTVDLYNQSWFADCNSDGMVDLSDAALLAKFMAGWNVTLGEGAESAGVVASGIIFSVDPVTVPEGETTVSVPVRISGLTDEDDLGAIQLNLAYDTTKLRLTDCKTSVGKGKDKITYDADCFDYFTCTDTASAQSPLILIALCTEEENPEWESEYEFNDDEFVVLDFDVLGTWADATPLTLSGTALRRSDDAPLQVSFTNGSVDPVRVSGVKLDAQELSVKINESASLAATVSPTNARMKTLTWTSSDTSVATVDNGLVSAIKPGTATITVTTQDGGFADTCTVMVYCEHESTTVVGYRDPTCSAEGYTGDTYCTICEGKLQTGTSIQTLPHTPAQSWTNDTNEHWHVCSVCGNDVDIEEHTFVENADAEYLKSVATCILPAIYYKSCSVCGYRSNETFAYGEVNPINHVDNSAKPLLADPYTHYKLCDCGERVLVANHTYQRVDAYTLKCSVCEHTHVFGDVNGDGVWTLSDVTKLAKAIAGWEMDESYHIEAADCNGDGIIGLGDVTRLAKKVAGWNVVLGPQV